MRNRLFLTLLTMIITSPAFADDHVPLEKQFFDFFSSHCIQSMNAQLQQQGKNPTDAQYHTSIETYCTCTAQAVVSWLSAEEILQFANDPEHEPGASRLKPYFLTCRDRAQQAAP